MHSIIKDRLKKIEQGIVPEGYKKTKVGIVPEDWEVKKLGELGEFLRGKGIPKSEIGNSGVDCIIYGQIYTIYNYFTKELYSKVDNEVADNSIDIEYGDLLFTSSGETREDIGKCVMYLGKKRAVAGGDIVIMRPKDIIKNKTYSYLLNSEAINKQKYKLGQGHSVVHLYSSHLDSIKTPLIPLQEQEKIADILSTWDIAIENIEKLIKEKEKQKKGLMQVLLRGETRLPGFTGEWEERSFESIFIRIPSKKYQVKKSNYLEKGLYPVVDQGKEKIVAYSNQENKLLEVPSGGIIVFGDHTREIKYINFNIVIGADGTQLLNVKENNSVKYYYYYLQNKKIPNTGYNRHFKFVRELNFLVPLLAEQKAIAEILSTADKEIELLNKLLANKKEEKKGLMQLLLTGIVRV